jgi:hypothetical protein
MRRSGIVLLLGLVTLLTAAAAYGQSPGRRGFGRGPRDGSDPRGRQGDRTDHFADHIAQMYDLNDQERALVRAELAEIRTQRETSADPQEVERRRLGEEMRQLWEQRRRGEPVDEQRMQQLRDQLRGAWSQSRAGWEQVMQQVESVIPPEKVAIGRERREQMRQRFAQRQQGGGPGPGQGDPRGRDRSRRDRSSRDRSSRDRGDAAADMRDDWQRYVDTFCNHFKLDAGQRASAQAILRECLERRDKIRQQSRDELMKVADISDAGERAAKMAELRKPIDDVFQELKDRLEQIPTTTQRLEAPAPTSAPTSRPWGRRSRRG